MMNYNDFDYLIYKSIKNGNYKLFNENVVSVKIDNCSDGLIPLPYFRILKKEKTFEGFKRMAKLVKEDMKEDGKLFEELSPTIQL